MGCVGGSECAKDGVADEMSILRFRGPLAQNHLARTLLADGRAPLRKPGALVDVAIRVAPGATKKWKKKRDPKRVSGNRSQPCATHKG